MMEPPPYSELSTFFGPLEKYAESCGLDEPRHHFRKAKMGFLAAYAAKPGKQSDIRSFA